jgi:hypothetical protein
MTTREGGDCRREFFAILPRASATTPLYVHEPLDTTKRQIRLLEIRRGGAQVEFSIVVQDGDTSSPYRPPVETAYWALSYVWGPPTPTYNILIDGKRFPIRANLYHFLQNYLRFPVPPPWGGEADVALGEDRLWIDQICIDQSNLQERTTKSNKCVGYTRIVQQF